MITSSSNSCILFSYLEYNCLILLECLVVVGMLGLRVLDMLDQLCKGYFCLAALIHMGLG